MKTQKVVFTYIHFPTSETTTTNSPSNCLLTQVQTACTSLQAGQNIRKYTNKRHTWQITKGRWTTQIPKLTPFYFLSPSFESRDIHCGNLQRLEMNNKLSYKKVSVFLFFFFIEIFKMLCVHGLESFGPSRGHKIDRQRTLAPFLPDCRRFGFNWASLSDQHASGWSKKERSE